MRYILDTNVLLFYIRDEATRNFIEDTYHPFSDEHEAIISIVSVGEILVLANRNKWGTRKLKVLQKLIDRLVIVEIKYEDLIAAYVEIEQFNANIHPVRKRKGSAIKMGKNDIWIAATTYTLNGKILTSDGDFDHLDGEFFEVLKFTQQ